MSGSLNLSDRGSAAGTQLENLVDEHVAARFYGISVHTLRRWRWLKTGPVYLKVGGSVRYRAADLEAYLQSRPMGGGPQVREVSAPAEKVAEGVREHL